MATLINADTSDGLKLTSDTSGVIEFQSAGTTKAGVNSTGLTGDGSQLTGLPAGGGLTLITSFATTSGTTVISPTIDLSTYKQLVVEFWSCSPDSAEDTSIRWANTGGTAQKLGTYGTNAGQGYYGRVTHDLVNKYIWTNIYDRDNTTLSATMTTGGGEVQIGVNNEITTSTTSLTFDWTSGQDFDLGNIYIYGLK